MAYRNATYIAFAAQGIVDPTASDIKYYNLMKGWKECENIDFYFVNSHEKTSSCRDTSSFQTIAARLKERLRNSKNMLLVVGEYTRFDNDFVPLEIEYAVKTCGIPIICCYPGVRGKISTVNGLTQLWPSVLSECIGAGMVMTMHVPFVKNILLDAINTFTVHSPPAYNVTVYSDEFYRAHGL